MESWHLDVVTGISMLALLIVLLVGLPGIVNGAAAGYAYIAAIVIFVIAMTAAGYAINKKIA